MIETKVYVVLLFWMVFLFAGIFINNSRVWLTFDISKSSNKYNRMSLLSTLSFFAAWLLAISIRDSYDLEFYRILYEARASHGKEWLFDLITFGFHDLGFSFDSFRIIWVSLVMFFLFRAIKRYSNNPCIVLAISMLTPFFAFVTQMRSALVSVIVLNSIELLIKGKIKDRIAYAFIIILCAQIHIVAYVYLLFLLVKPNERKHRVKFYYLFVSMVTVFAIAISLLPSSKVVDFVNMLPIPDFLFIRLKGYISNVSLNVKSAIAIVVKFVFLFILTEQACVKCANKCIPNKKICEIRFIRKMNMLMLLFIPIALVNYSFERVFYFFMIIQYSMIFTAGKSKFNLCNKVYINICIKFLMLLGFGVIMYICIRSNFDDLLRALNSIAIF